MLLAFERRYRTDHTQEHAALWDANGKLVVERTGTYDSVTFTPQELEQACMGTATHTHPRALPPSKADLSLAARYGLTLRAVGDAPDTGERVDYTVRMPEPSLALADHIVASYDDDYEHAVQHLDGLGGLQLEREARHMAINRMAREFGFYYHRADVPISEMSRAEKMRLDSFANVEVSMQHEVWQPLHAQIVKTLTRNTDRNGRIPIERMIPLRSDVARLVTRTMLGAASSDGTLVPFRVAHGQIISHSIYFKTLLDAMHIAASAAVQQHARMMRKYLPDDLVRAYEYATVSPFDQAVTEADDVPDPLHSWLGSDGKRLSDRIWQATGEMRAKLDLYLAEAVSMDKPVSQMARELEQFLVEGRGSYEAMRLARTEVAFAHSRADFAAAQQNPFVEQYEFFTAPSHQCCDECDEVEKNSPYDKNDMTHMPPRHPNCVLPGTTVYVPGWASAASKAFYVGTCIKVTTRNGLQLSITPNHPILTSRGWVAAVLLSEADQVVVATDPQRIAFGVNPDNDNMPTLIEDVFSSLEETSGVPTRTMPSSPEHFHGDAVFFDGNVNIVYANRFLLRNNKTLHFKPAGEFRFSDGNTEFSGLDGEGALQVFSEGAFSPTRSGIGLFGHSLPVFDAHLGVHEGLALAESSDVDVMPDQERANGISADTQLVREFLDRFSSEIAFDDVVSVERFPYSGHVYDLQSDPYHLYISNGIITHNCVCGTRWIIVEQPSTVVDKIRAQVAQAVASAKQAVTDVVGPLSRRFVDLLFRAR